MRLKILLFLFITPAFIFAQKENQHWFFGNGAGLNFSTSPPTVLSTGSLYTNEGCSSFSNEKGELLFYTDGVTVWDKNHDEMPNGQNLNGNYSTTQSALIIPKPDKPNHYYIFTCDEKAGKKGVSYSVIDIRNRNGLGDVVKKNIPLVKNTTEKLAATLHSNKKEYWLITHEWNGNTFSAWLITANGVSQQPVNSRAGVEIKNYTNSNNAETIGYMQISSDGKTIACANERVPQGNIELFDFDNTTGKINLRASITTENKYCYGMCFSPDDSKLYVSFETDGGIIQYDLRSNAIQSSGKWIARNGSRRFGALQLGPDQKIYIATSLPFLDIIAQPNESANACNYIYNGIDLKGKFSSFGLPNFVNINNQLVESTKKSIEKKLSKCNPPLKVNLGNDTLLCGDPIQLKVTLNNKSYLWSTGSTEQSIKAERSGVYWVKVNDDNCYTTDSIRVTYMGKPTTFAPMKEFTPGNVVLNSRFDYIINNVIGFNLKIYKKQKLVFESNSIDKKWDGFIDGKIAPAGTYRWEITYTPACPPQTPVFKTGDVEVLKK